MQDSAADAFDAASEQVDNVRSKLAGVELPALPAFERPEFVDNLLGFFQKREDSGKGKSRADSDSEEGGADGPGRGPGALAALMTAAAASPMEIKNDEDIPSSSSGGRPTELMLLTKKLIGIRSILLSIGESDSLTLPSIVVIGSQSSGKSSVLEAVVGHEFLPK